MRVIKCNKESPSRIFCYRPVVSMKYKSSKGYQNSADRAGSDANAQKEGISAFAEDVLKNANFQVVPWREALLSTGKGMA